MSNMLQELVEPELKAGQSDHFRPWFRRFVLRKAPVEHTNGQRNASSGSVSLSLVRPFGTGSLTVLVFQRTTSQLQFNLMTLIKVPTASGELFSNFSLR